MGKAQTSILGVVIITGIVLALVSVTYIWGQPLIQKNVDRAHTNLVMDKMDEIDDAILYTSSTGSNSVVDLDLSTSTFVIDAPNNRIIYQTYSTVPIIASVTEVPINYYELATERESKTYNATWTTANNPALSGYETTTHHTNTTIGDVFYNVTIYQNSTSSAWELVCFWKAGAITKLLDCAEENQAVTKESTTIDMIGIETDGTGAYTLGAVVENKGVLGSEPSGIVSAKSVTLADKEKITFYLTYRAMISADNEEYSIILQCADNCVASNNNKKLVISRVNVLMTSTEVNTYIKLEVQ